MMAKKVALFGDTTTELRIRTTNDPAVQNPLEQTVIGFDQERWHRHRYDIVFNEKLDKKMQNPDLLRALVATGNQHLAETSPYDLV